MRKDKDKTKSGTKQNPPAKQKQEIDPTELTDEDLSKVSGGIGGGSSDADNFKLIKSGIG